MSGLGDLDDGLYDGLAEQAFHEYQLQEQEEKHKEELWEAFKAGALSIWQNESLDWIEETVRPEFNNWLREMGRA